MGKEKHKSGRRRAGTKILFQIVSLILIVFIASAFISYLFFRNSQNNVIQNSKDKLVEHKARLFCSTNRYCTNIAAQIVMVENPGISLQTMTNDLAIGFDQNTLTPMQTGINGLLEQMVDDNFFNSRMALYAFPPESGAGYGSMIVMSSDPETIYQELPSELRDLATMGKSGNGTGRVRVDDQNSYEFFKDGVPGIGLEGEYLVTAYVYSPDPAGSDLWFFNFSSMHDELAAVDKFYSEENGKINTALILLIIGMSVVLVLLMLVVLSHLIQKNISRPINELEAAAEQAMEGDLEVEVPIREGEEFEGLKTVFNNMLISLRDVLDMATGSGKSADTAGRVTPSAEKDTVRAKRKRRGGRSSIFFKVAVMVVLIFIIQAAVMMIMFNGSQTRLAEKTKQRFVRSTAETLAGNYVYLGNMVQRYFYDIFPQLSDPKQSGELVKSYRTKNIDPMIEKINETIRLFPEQGIAGMIMNFQAMAPTPGIFDVPTIVMGSEDELMFQELPDGLIELHDLTAEESSAYKARIDEGTTYMLVDDGPSYLGLSGKHLIVNNDHHIEAGVPVTYWVYTIKPMEEELAEIESFFNGERNNLLVSMGIVLSASGLLAVVLIMFVLGYLLRTRITEPVDELEVIAERVMKGELDIDIPIQAGEEFEGLKRAFAAMLESLQKLVDKSSTDDS
ncbi:MAG: HAMP domain-containing protein [Actinobacteria bacterium]|nr:HAMP domain-containing protein [Actinomycetota bacterium]